MDKYPISDMQFLNMFKAYIRDITKLLDEKGIKKYPVSQESHEVKHATLILLTELQFHNLLPEGVTIAAAEEKKEEDL